MVNSFKITPLENSESTAHKVTGQSISETENVLIEPVTTPDGAACWRITRNGEAVDSLVYESRDRAIQELPRLFGS